MVSGAELIAAERQRQIKGEGYTPEHDANHLPSVLAEAAGCYLRAALIAMNASRSEAAVRRALEHQGVVPEDDEDYRHMIENPPRWHFGWDKAPKDWPWLVEDWKPSSDPIRNLVRAGALIAAEVDRLQPKPVQCNEAGHWAQPSGY